MKRRDWIRKTSLAFAATGISGTFLRGQSTPESGRARIRYPELKLVNLAGNENPYGPSPAVSMAIMKEVRNSCRYPFREEVVLREMLAEIENVPVESILLGNGCDEILSLAGDVYSGIGFNIVATAPTYLQLMHYAENRGSEIKWIEHDKEDMSHDLESMKAAVDENTKLVYICNPDTPTGTLLPAERLRSFCSEIRDSTTVFIDEVYLDLLDDFKLQTQVELVRQGAPVIIGRSFSKMHGLAGLRVGYAVARPDIVEKLSERRMSSMNYLGVMAAIASVKDHSFHAQSARLIRQGRDRFCSLLNELKLPFIPSYGNFVFHWTGIPIREFQEKMRQKNFLVGRPFPPYEEWCRISIGNESEMSAYEQAMRELYA